MTASSRSSAASATNLSTRGKTLLTSLEWICAVVSCRAILRKASVHTMMSSTDRCPREVFMFAGSVVGDAPAGGDAESG